MASPSPPASQFPTPALLPAEVTIAGKKVTLTNEVEVEAALANPQLEEVHVGFIYISIPSTPSPVRDQRLKVARIFLKRVPNGQTDT